MQPTKSSREHAEDVFRRHGGTLNMSDALRHGVTRYTLYAMHDEARLIRLARGVYRLADMPALSNPDLVIVAQRIPKGVICLISALAFHELTTQIPHVVWVAVKRISRVPKIEWPPVRVLNFSKEAYSSGTETHELDGVPVTMYSREKTLADCFKYRRKIGRDVALEALKTYLQSGKIDIDALMKYARVCRVSNVIRPYLEAML